MKLASTAALAAFLVSPCFAAEPSAAAKLYGTLPLVQDVHLSPDGNYLALQSGAQGEESFVVMDITGKDARVLPRLGEDVAAVQTVRASWIAWKGPSKLLAGVLACRETADSDRIFATDGFILDRDDGDIHPIYLNKARGPLLNTQFRDRVVSFLPDDPGHVLMEARVEDALYPDVMQVDVATGVGHTIVRARSGFTDWMADGAGAIRLAVAFPHRDLQRTIYVRAGADDGWQPIHRDVVGTDPAFVPLAFSRQDPAILFVGVEENGHLAIRRFDTRSLTLGESVAADPKVDAVPVLRRGELVGYRLGDGPIVYLDEPWRHTADALRNALPGADIELVDRSADGRRTLVLVTDGAQPPEYYLLDKRADGTHLDPLGATRDRRVALHSAPVFAVSYPAQDGTLVPAYITLPPGPQKGPVPFVVLAHDGPAGHDDGRFDYLAQFLANSGYGVFQPQFRGSTAATGSLGNGVRLAGLGAEQAAVAPNVVVPSSPNDTLSAQRSMGNLSAFKNTYGGPGDYERNFGLAPNASIQLERVSGPGGVDTMLGPTLQSIVDRHFTGLSNGVGAAYARAGYGGWGRSVQDDITDGTHWLIAQGYAIPNRICIAGAGFGGYSALMGVARERSLYRCAAAFAPVTDLDRLNTDARSFLNANYLRGYLRANETLSDVSPVSQADRIDVAVLLVHGAQDCDVPMMQSEEMEAALRRGRDRVGDVQIADVRSKEEVKPAASPARPGRSVTAVYLDDADHALSRQADRVAYLAALEEFLAKNLRP